MSSSASVWFVDSVWTWRECSKARLRGNPSTARPYFNGMNQCLFLAQILHDNLPDGKTGPHEALALAIRNFLIFLRTLLFLFEREQRVLMCVFGQDFCGRRVLLMCQPDENAMSSGRTSGT